MTRTLRAAVAVMMSAGGLLAVGCASGPGAQARFQDVNNNYGWPERNGFLARQAVLHPFEVQANNAVSTDGVMLNAYFDNGTATLNGVGRDKLDQLSRKMPQVNSTVYLQTANDVVYDEKAPEKTSATRSELDGKRAAAVAAYLSSRPNTKNVPFNVVALDNADPSTYSAGPAASVRGLAGGYRSGITGGFSGGNPIGAGGGQATNTVGVAPTTTAPAQGGGGGSIPAGGGGGTGGSGPLLR